MGGCISSCEVEYPLRAMLGQNGLMDTWFCYCNLLFLRYKIWHYSGRELHKYDVAKNFELWQVFYHLALSYWY